MSDSETHTWSMLLDAYRSYLATVSPHYDEILRTVARHIDQTGVIDKADIGALVFWKRLRADTVWARKLHAIPDVEIKRATSQAVTSARDTGLSLTESAVKGRAALASLPGLETGDALASALLYAAAPDRMAVYDRRVQHGIQRLGMTLSGKPGRYGRYLTLITDLLHHRPDDASDWQPRHVDLALYTIGRQQP